MWTKGVPVEVVPLAMASVHAKMEAVFGGKSKLRMAVAKAGPVVTGLRGLVLSIIWYGYMVAPFHHLADRQRELYFGRPFWRSGWEQVDTRLSRAGKKVEEGK